MSKPSKKDTAPTCVAPPISFEGKRQTVNLRADVARLADPEVRAAELSLVYQPIWHLDSGEMHSVEALLRWRHPRLGELMPDMFIGLLEDEPRLMNSVGAWVMQQVCRCLAAWRRQDRTSKLPIAINLSRVQLTTPGFAQQLQGLVHAHAIEPGDICLEVTETAFVHAQHVLVKSLTRLRDAGYRVAIDDFGVGHSSLAALHRLPADALKLDKSFIAGGIRSGTRQEALLESVIQIGHRMGLTVIAEGIEYEEQMEWLREAGCDYGQGYYLGLPLALECSGGVNRED